MRLEAVDIRDYRSIFVDEGGRSLSMQLGEGMNTLVGQNNCGKSNVLRAISLALDPNHQYSPASDVPGPREFAHPIITLTFRADGERPEQTELLATAEQFERVIGVPAGSTFAEQGIVKLRVSFVPLANGVERRETLLVPGERVPTTNEQLGLLELSLKRLREAIRFVLISSGESIKSVLDGNFREILHSVVQERLRAEFDRAETSRQEYITGLQGSLLAPLRDRLKADVGRMFPEIDGIDLIPEVSSIAHTLSNVGVNLDDIVNTPLEGKGTGVRGGVLVAMLSYLALSATRGMVFALEEPEAFLHPAAQEDLRDRLEELAAATGVTLLVTSHSPFIVTRSPHGRVFCLAKDAEGRTRLSESAAGDADHAGLIGDLMREQSLVDLLTAATAIPVGTQLIVLVEGDGDRLCFERAAQAVGRPDLLDGIHIRPTGGTTKMIAQAVLTRAASDLPMLFVTDNDDAGKKVKDTLAGNTFEFAKKQFITYASLFDQKWQNFPFEAEDLFAPELIQGFVEEHGEKVAQGFQWRPDDARHWDFGPSAKELIDAYLAEHTRAEHVEKWIELIARLREEGGLPLLGTVEEILAAAPDQPDGDQGQIGANALIVAGQHDYARYSVRHALLLDPNYQLPPDVSHVGFYSGAAIQPVVPAVRADHPHLLFNLATAKQLRATQSPADGHVAELIESALAQEADLAEKTFRVLLLTPPDHERTLQLEQEITNTKKAKNGRPLAWAVGHKTVAVSSLQASPTTTDELDALESKEQVT